MPPDGVLGRVIDRRGALGALGVLALVGCSSGGRSESSKASTSSRAAATSSSTAAGTGASTTACTLTPEETAGPYPLDLSDNQEFFRRDITEGRTGVPLTLELTVLAVGGSCAPLANTRVDVWQCDREGVYSGFSQPGESTVGETFLRGIQLTDADGKATFETIYPGWYQGRATHIHFQVYLNDGLAATSQLAFPDDVTEQVYSSDLYRARGQNSTTTDEDGVFRDGTAGELLALTGDVASGYVGALTVGIES